VTESVLSSRELAFEGLPDVHDPSLFPSQEHCLHEDECWVRERLKEASTRNERAVVVQKWTVQNDTMWMW